MLIRRAQRGDAGALDDLARQVLPRLRRWARTHVAGDDDADDVAQTALIAAMRAIASFDFRAQIHTWLYRILRRCAADHFRANRRRTALAERHMALASYEWTPPSEPDVDAERIGARVRECFRNLPARQREVFDLVELQGVTADDVAAMLNIAPPTVRVHLLRARRTLRRLIIEMDPALAEDRNGMHDGA